MSNGKSIVVPAELIEQVKEGLIKLGYATENTDPAFVQDCYFKWVMINQTGFNPHMPYALCLLPKTIRDILGVEGCGDGGTVDPEPTGLHFVVPSSSDYMSLIDEIKANTWVLNSPFVVDQTILLGSSDINMSVSAMGVHIGITNPAVIDYVTADYVRLRSTGLPILFEVVGMTDAKFNDIVAGTSPTAFYTMDEAGPDGWIELPNQYIGAMVIKHPPSGKYYTALVLDRLSLHTGNPGKFIAVDEDGAGIEFAKVVASGDWIASIEAEEPDDGTLKLVQPKIPELISLYDNIRTGLWSDALDTLFNPKHTPMASADSFEILGYLGDNKELMIQPLDFDHFYVGNTAVRSDSLVPSILELKNLTDAKASELMDGSSVEALYQVSGDGVTAIALPRGYYPEFLSKNPVNNKWYVTLPSQLYPYKSEQGFGYYLGIDLNGDGTVDNMASATTVMPDSLKPPVDSKGSVYLSMVNSSDYMDIYSRLYNGTLAMPASLGISASDLLAPNMLSIGGFANTNYLEYEPTYSDNNLMGFYVTPTNEASFEPVHLGECTIADNKRVLTITRMTGLSQTIDTLRTVEDFVSGNTPYSMKKSSDVLHPEILLNVTLNKNNSPTTEQIAEALGHFLVDGDSVYYCTLVDTIGSASQQNLIIQRGVTTESTKTIGTAIIPTDWSFVHADVLGNEIATYNSPNTIYKQDGETLVDGFAGIHVMSKGEYVSFDIGALLSSSDPSLVATLRVCLVPSDAYVGDLTSNVFTSTHADKEFIRLHIDNTNPDNNTMRVNRNPFTGNELMGLSKITVTGMTELVLDGTSPTQGDDPFLVYTYMKDSQRWGYYTMGTNYKPENDPNFVLSDNQKIAFWFELESYSTPPVLNVTTDIRIR